MKVVSGHGAEEFASFTAAARSYLSVIAAVAGRQGEREQTKDELIAIQRALVEVHAAALALPEVPWETVADEPDFSVRPLARPFYEDLRQRVGERDTYYCLEYGEIVRRSVADDLSEIAGDIEAVLGAVENGVPISVALWELRLLFWTHWGAHLVDVMRRLYQLVSDTSLDAA